MKEQLMTDQQAAVGTIVWHDLTIDNASEVRDFYCSVVGWQSEPVSMGDYDDFNMNKPNNGDTAAGVCHARGANASLPPQWLMYVRVADADVSAKRCTELGGQVLAGPRKMGAETYYTLQDPAGAVLAIFS
jgi:predicted enzyme related to lactoylglutathione lyase